MACDVTVMAANEGGLTRVYLRVRTGPVHSAKGSDPITSLPKVVGWEAKKKRGERKERESQSEGVGD